MELTAVTRELDVFVSDDSHDDVLLIERALRRGPVPCAVRHDEDPAAFERAVAERTPDVVLVDHHMPRLDGLAALRRAQAQMESIGRVSLSPALAEGDLEALAREITEEATAVCGVARANVWLFDKGESELHCIDLYEAGTRRHTAGARLREDQYESEFRALKAARYVDASDALTDPRTAGSVEGYLKPAGITAMIDVAVQVAGAQVGLLCLEHVGGPRHWEHDEIAYACQLADKVGLALGNRERREAERELRFKNAILAAQQEASLDAILVVGEDRRIVSFNRRFVEMWGIPVELIATRSDDLAVQFVLPKLAAPEEFLRKVDYLREHERETLADELALRDGRSIERFSAPLVDEEGQLHGRVMHFRDITARKRSEQDLRRAMANTVEAMAATMASRDPYTASHERRVADLAAAIGREMGLDEFTVEGLHFGALIHDIGKIQVPGELLVKPTRLTEIELDLVKTHALIGYEIVKGIDFPWPVARMVLQHHERIDGSGYPHGARGEEIALEARILAVADVVEAMASNRPYRPGLGIDAALSEVESKRGTAFDAAAVDACLRLFRDGRYTLPGT